MYYLNNTVIVLHKDLFIHLDLGFLGSYHDVTILHHSDFYRRWCVFFTHTDGYFRHYLGDHGYHGDNMFIMQHLGQVKHSPDMDEGALTAYNKMHARYQVGVEWGIGSLKLNYGCLMKRFDATRRKYNHLFRVAAT